MKKPVHFLIILILLIGVSTFVGRYGSISEIINLKNNEIMKNVIIYIRLPRIAISLLVGAGLAISGLVMQNIFQNPLADPGILGISQAAGFGAALGFLLKPKWGISVQILAFGFGIFALFLVLYFSKSMKSDNQMGLIFSGIAISAFFTSGLGIIKYLADPLDTLPSIVFWLLGSISSSTWQTVLDIAPVVIICIVSLYFVRWRLNIYSLNDEVLHSLGIKKKRELNLILVVSVLLTTTVISVAGLVGWVGLIIPNIVRLVFGYEMSKSLPVSIIFGGGFVLISDTIARAAIAGEIPLGIITAFFGAGTLIYIIQKQNILA